MEGAKIGMAKSSCASFSHSRRGAGACGQSLSSYTTSYRTQDDVKTVNLTDHIVSE